VERRQAALVLPVKPWATFWRALDQARFFPRVCLLGYAYMAYDLHRWFTLQADISAPQTVYISVVWGAFPILLNFYMQNGVKWDPAPPQSQMRATATVENVPAQEGKQ
jgi:hypothetical protein